MSHFPTIADAEEAGAPGCFSDEYAFHERNGTLPPGGSFPGPPSSEYDHLDDGYPPEEEDEPQGAPAPAVATVYCPEGNDNVCPTATCGCPPF